MTDSKNLNREDNVLLIFLRISFRKLSLLRVPNNNSCR